MTQSLYSYVVAFDSGFAPNPFHGVCTLATCKPPIRKSAQVGDWIVGTGSANKKTRRGGHLVHAMKVSETISTESYWKDDRFADKKPNLYCGWERASGDNIYEPLEGNEWRQLDSYHSNPDGSPRKDHTKKDTSVPRVLISNQFVYFGGEGPKLPDAFQFGGEFCLVKTGIGYNRKKDKSVIQAFEGWFNSLKHTGVQGKPWDWLKYMEMTNA
jgi:hypothetical protein